MDRFEPHDCGEPIGRNLAVDGEELARPVLVGTLPNLKKGVQDQNKDVLVDGEQEELVKAFGTPRDNSSQFLKNKESCVVNGSRRGVRIRAEGAACGELLGGFGDRPFLCEILVERQRGIPLVQDLG